MAAEGHWVAEMIIPVSCSVVHGFMETWLHLVLQAQDTIIDKPLTLSLNHIQLPLVSILRWDLAGSSVETRT